MKKYKYKDGIKELEAELEEKDFFLIRAIDNLAKEIERLRMT